MKFSVIVPFYNAADTLELCLRSFAKQVHENFEIILVDNNSSDHSSMIASCFAEAEHPFPVKLIKESAPGAGHARNAGIATAHGEWIVFTDADCVLSPTWLEEYDQMTQNVDPTIGALAGSIHSTKPRNIVQACAGLFTLPPITEARSFNQLAHGTGGFPTANMAVRKKVLDATGGFSLGNTCGEDYQLCADIYNAGYRINAFPKAIAFHIHRDKLKPFLKQAVNIGVSNAYTRRNLSARSTIIELPRRTWTLPGLGRIWIDLNQADKKMFVLLLPALFWWPLVVLPLLYLSHLCRFCLDKCLARGTHIAPWNLPLVALMLLFKSAALTWGRIQGSLMYKVICF